MEVRPLPTRDYTGLIAKLADEYARRSPISGALQERAEKVMIDGGSHTLRLIQPFPPRIVAAQGAWLTDEDGHRILDFWQGHFANLLGHNPRVITEELAEALRGGFGLQTGMQHPVEAETAELVRRCTGAEQVRFTTSGSLATMYAILLSRAYTGRDLVLKVGGGWHGSHPWGMRGVGFIPGREEGFQHVDTVGLPASIADTIVVSNFNYPERLRDDFRKYVDRLACFTV